MTGISPRIPVNDRNDFSVGAGYDFNKDMTLDVAYMYIRQKELHQTASPNISPPALKSLRNGTYSNARAHLIGLSVNYKF